jgi:hypothetical protein
MENIVDSKRSRVLFLPGITLSDCYGLGGLFQHKVLDSSTDDDPTIGKIPPRFTELKLWPTGTNLKCWHCDLIPKERPIFVPQNIEPTLSHERCMRTKGSFCSFNCAQAYINTEYSGEAKKDKTGLLLILYRIFNGKVIQSIQPSPEKYIMTTYGGSTTPDEYRHIIASLDKNFEKSIIMAETCHHL